MKRFLWAMPLALLVGCENVETGLTVLGAALPESTETCAFNADGDGYYNNITFDAANADTLALNLRVRNTLQGGTVNFGTADQPDTFRLPNTVTPLRMEFRFECDTNGFSDELGPLYVPQFSVEKPFCFDRDTREFKGLDVVPASGPAIEPSENAIVLVRPITTQLARALNDVFILADQAEACCGEVMGCNQANLQNAPTTGNGPCARLQTEFNRIAPNKLSVTRLEDIQKFRPYRLFDHLAYPPRPANNQGDIDENQMMNGGPETQVYGAAYPLRLRGVLEGITGDGETVSSTEYFEIIHLCAHCKFTLCTTL
jgi:hypothetical protein